MVILNYPDFVFSYNVENYDPAAGICAGIQSTDCIMSNILMHPPLWSCFYLNLIVLNDFCRKYRKVQHKIKCSETAKLKFKT